MLKKSILFTSLLSILTMSNFAGAGEFKLGDNLEVVYYKNYLTKNFKVDKKKVVINTKVNEIKEKCFREESSRVCFKYGFGKVYEVSKFIEILTKKDFDKKLKEKLEANGFEKKKSDGLEINKEFSNVYENKDYVYAYELKDLNYNYLITTVKLNKEIRDREEEIKNNMSEKILNESFNFIK